MEKKFDNFMVFYLNKSEREQEIKVSLYADKMLRLALDKKNKIKNK